MGKKITRAQKMARQLEHRMGSLNNKTTGELAVPIRQVKTLDKEPSSAHAKRRAALDKLRSFWE